MSRELPRADVDRPSDRISDIVQDPIEPHEADFGTGPVRVAHADGAGFGRYEEAGVERLALYLWSSEEASGLLFTPTPDFARDIARRLLSAAEAVEAEAAAAAADVINRAGRQA